MSKSYSGDQLLLRIDKETCQRLAGQMYLELYPNFQRSFQLWSDKMRQAFIESIELGRVMNPIWTVFNDEDNQEEVLDGMHRLGHYVRFIQDKFKYKGKCFSQLDYETQNKIRNYDFTFNKLDSSYKKNPDKLFFQYQILNKSSIPLNKFEVYKPILLPFYELIQAKSGLFAQTILFPQKTFRRGRLEWEICQMLALSEKHVPSFSSFDNLTEQWISRYITFDGQQVEQNVRKCRPWIMERLVQLLCVMDMCQTKQFFTRDGICLLDNKGLIGALTFARIFVCRVVAFTQGKNFEEKWVTIQPSFWNHMVPLLEQNSTRIGSFYGNLVKQMDTLFS